jgi:hypothetical protein
VHVAVPPGHEATAIEIRELRATALTDGATLVTPIPRPELAAAIDARLDGVGFRRRQEWVGPTPPDERLYETELREPRPPARLLETNRIGLTPVAIIELNPVRYTEDGRLELVEEIVVVVEHRPTEPDAADRDRSAFAEAGPISPGQARRFFDHARATVVNPELVENVPDDLIRRRSLYYEYLVITRARGDTSWWRLKPHGETFASVFQRLVDWKWSRGIRGRVVTVEEIEAGVWGDFSQGARDRPEVLRRFLQWAVPNWGVSWVLLGGSDDLIPARRVAGYFFAEIRMQAQDPPPPNTSFWNGRFLKMQVDNPGDGWPGSIPADLVRLDNGLKIPFDPTGSSSNAFFSHWLGHGHAFGWHFTTDDTYQTFSPTPTKYVRVNGSASEIAADHHFVYESNALPTDLYYASLFDWRYGRPGKHDWDSLDNGLYGQHTNVDLDGVAYHADASVGRAPVHYLEDARAFVDKVIAYEKGRRVDGASVDRDWNRRIVFAAANWGGRWWASATNTTPPEAARYHHQAGSGKSLIHFEGTPSSDWRLISQVTDADLRVLPFDTSASQSGRGWYWAKSATDETPSMGAITFFNQTIPYPLPTEWVVAYGTEDEMAPAAFLLDQMVLDGSAAAQEARRKELPSELPELREVWRLYEDEGDVPLADVPAAPLDHLNEARLKAAMERGPHFLSLSGHGNPGWICFLFNDDWRSLSTPHLFITYASGCMTAWYEGEDVMGQIAVNNPHGAVAYVGYSRDGWIGSCDTVENTFFHALRETQHLGLLNDARLQTITDDTSPYDRWMIFVQNLFGDPEMPIWTRAPRTFLVDRDHLADQSRLVIHVQDEDDGARPVGRASVQVRQDETTWGATTDNEGRAEIELVPEGIAPFEVTISAPTYAPAELSIAAEGPGWMTGTVAFLDCRPSAARVGPGGTSVGLHIGPPNGSDQRVRTWIVPFETPHHDAIVAALADAYSAGIPISLYVDNVETVGPARGFRLGVREESQGADGAMQLDGVRAAALAAAAQTRQSVGAVPTSE